MFPWQEGEVGVSLLPEGSRSPTCLPGCEGRPEEQVPSSEPISCPEPWDSIHLLHLGVRVVLRDVEVALPCALVSAADPDSACP